jgi:hypothetical protein
MAVANGYGKTVTSGSVFAYDVGDTINSYKGEPTTNLLPNGVAFGHSSGVYGNVVTVTDATEEKGPGWKKVTISNRGNNVRIIQWTYLAMSANITYCHSAEFDWGNMRGKGYFMDLDGNGTGIRTYYRPGNYSSAGSVQIDSTMPDGKFAATIIHTSSHTHAFFIRNNTYNVSGLNDYFYYKEFQVEAKSHPTQYTTGTRSSTQGLLPLVGNSTIDLSNVSFNSNAQKIFDGTDDRITLTDPILPQYNWTIEIVIKCNDFSNSPIFLSPVSAGIDHFLRFSSDGKVRFQLTTAEDVGNRAMGSNYIASTGETLHAVFTRTSLDKSIYINGNLDIQSSDTTSSATWSGTWTVGTRGNVTFPLNGEIYVLKAYNRILSAAEVRQNYNNYKTRFNLS